MKKDISKAPKRGRAQQNEYGELGRDFCERTRRKIQAANIVVRLQGFVLGGVDPKTKNPIEMSPAQVRAAEVLLRKVLPDMTWEHHTGGQGVVIEVVDYREVADTIDRAKALSTIPDEGTGQRH